MKNPSLKLSVSKVENGTRLDVFCARKVDGHSRSYFTKLASTGHIKINDQKMKPSYKVRTGEVVQLEMETPPPLDAQPENIKLNIIYEDDYLLIVNKPSGMVCHPAAGNYTGTLINALLYHFSNLKNFSDKIRPGLVHRLDKDTSGLLIVAKDEKTLSALQTLMKKRLIERTYFALVWGKMPHAKGTIDLPIGRSRSDRKKMKVFGISNRQAITHYEVIDSYTITEMLKIKLGTGRTHQIRSHLSYFGHPVVGDPTYGGRSKAVMKFTGPKKQLALSLLNALDSQALHASHLSFEHPHTGKIMNFDSDLPDDMQKAIGISRSNVR
ncbi:MAG: hypothetical protein B6D58_05760 [candidate division Zixibacteria bacterium 4484_95]|nr:MAG: hypothetical protein B6D58_05760 [candidate division Zixibacteria bacterium 4484_95]